MVSRPWHHGSDHLCLQHRELDGLLHVFSDPHVVSRPWHHGSDHLCLQHRELDGLLRVFQTLTWCQDLGITEVTIYAFSIENLMNCYMYFSDPHVVSRPWHHGSDHLCLQHRELYGLLHVSDPHVVSRPWHHRSDHLRLQYRELDVLLHVFQTLTWCQDLGITEVTIYAFSIENLMYCYMFQTLTWCQDLGITEVTIYAFSIENLMYCYVYFRPSRGVKTLASQK